MYNSTSRGVLAYALRRAGSKEHAEDAFSETYVIAWQKFDQVPPDYAGPWLFATCRNVLANQARRMANSKEIPGLPATEDFADLTERVGPDALVAKEALRGLGEPDREILMLSAWEGLNATELGRALGCSALAARVRLLRARRALESVVQSLSDRGEKRLSAQQVHVNYQKVQK
jgi:RNA polymerase sigma-70 factor, ECF subfamily